MIAWKLSCDFNTQKHLFADKITTQYVVETYICSCGFTDFVLKYLEDRVEYECDRCQNSEFYDANSAWKNLSHFLAQSKELVLNFDYDLFEEERYILSRYYTSIPTSIDFLRGKVFYSKKDVHSVTLTKEGEIKENYSLGFSLIISSVLKENLTEYINEHNCYSLPKTEKRELTLAMATFFLKNRDLKEFDFYYWVGVERLKGKALSVEKALQVVANYSNAKSVKRAIYKNYVTQMSEHSSFDFTFTEVFCQLIDDVNILSRLLSLNIKSYKHNKIESRSLYEFIKFLKTQYSEKQLLKLFFHSEFKSYNHMFRDVVREFMYNSNVVVDNFHKVSCSVQALHDEFVRCTSKERYRSTFESSLTYTEQEMKPCIAIATYEIKLPNNGKALFEWAEELHNCMAGYFESIKNSEIAIYGFFEEETLLFAVEISDNELVQASGKYNTRLTTQEEKALYKWFKLFFDTKPI